MRDRSTMPPEQSLFPRDERTLEQRYEDVRAERDELELKVHDLSELVTAMMLGRVDVVDLAQSMWKRADKVAPLPPRPKRPRPERQVPSVVYYVEMHGRVKIGFSTSFVTRMQTFYVRPDQVLAVEPGDQTTEYVRHQQFAAGRVGTSELFEHSEELDAHIADLRAKHPKPWETGAKITGAVGF